MQLTINEKKENSLLKRVDVQGKLEFTGATPANKEVQEAIAKEFKVDDNLVVVKKVDNLFGKMEAVFQASVYDKLEAKQKIEKVTKHMRKQAEEAKKANVEEKKEAPKESEASEESKAVVEEAPKAEEIKKEAEEKPAEKGE